MPTADCLEILEQLIAHRTVNPGGDEPALARFLAGALEERGADHIEVVEVPREGEVGAYTFARFGAPEVLLNVHIDTVPAAPGWIHDPFALTPDGDDLYGLGTADTKGAAAAALAAMSRAKPKNLAVLFSGDEERSTTCMRHFIASDRAAQIRRAVVCEPTGRAAGIRHRGMTAYRLTVPGVGGHSSRADFTAKPLVTAARLALALDEMGERYLDQGPEGMKGLCLNVAEIEGGVAFNVIPPRAELVFSFRQPPGFDADRWRAELGTCLRSAGANIGVECMLARAPFEVRDIDAFAGLLGDYPAGQVSLDFWTEASILADAGIDAVVIGPGDIGVAHAAEEHVPAADLEWAEAMFADLFARL